MKTLQKTLLTIASLLVGATAVSQENRQIDNFRYPDQRGINVFEAPKDTVFIFDGLKVRVGGAMALQYQSLEHENRSEVELMEIGNNFNLATANLDLDVALAPGLRMHLRTYLSSRNHPEPYVKGGYLQIDDLSFINEDLLSDVMRYVTIKFGHMENNYGDAHFRRSDNAQTIFNPLVGNYIMDAFTTEVGGEVYYRRNGFLAMLGATNGKLNQAVTVPGGTSPSLLWKLGYDKQLDDDLRLRLTGSMYHSARSARIYLYSGDRAGSRYYFVMEDPDASSSGNFTSGRFNPGFNNRLTAVMINPFVKYRGLEFFGMYERSEGRANSETKNRLFNQYGAELLYRFGYNENFYIGGRYNQVSGEQFLTGNNIDITRFQAGAGWFLTKNILTKAEYINQAYKGFAVGDRFEGGRFNGLMVEAVISF